MREIFVGGTYLHFKGNTYIVLNIGKHTETGEQMVIYKSTKDGAVYVRPYGMFASKVDTEKYPNVKQEYRLELLHK